MIAKSWSVLTSLGIKFIIDHIMSNICEKFKTKHEFNLWRCIIHFKVKYDQFQ